MTRIISHPIKCKCCGKVEKQVLVCSLMISGGEDLDGRRPFGAFLNPMTCSFCGAVWSRLDELPTTAIGVVNSAEYQTQLTDMAFPDSANQYRCKSMLHETQGEFEQAAYAMLHAAWECDSEAYAAFPALMCRMDAVGLMLRAGLEGPLLVDVMRRSIYHKEALALIDKLLEQRPTTEERRILEFQRGLLKVGDDGCYTKQAALGQPELNYFGQPETDSDAYWVGPPKPHQGDVIIID